MIGMSERRKQVWTEIRSFMILFGTEDPGEDTPSICTYCSTPSALYLRGNIPNDRKRFSMSSSSVVRNSDDKNKIMMNQLPV